MKVHFLQTPQKTYCGRFPQIQKNLRVATPNMKNQFLDKVFCQNCVLALEREQRRQRSGKSRKPLE